MDNVLKMRTSKKLVYMVAVISDKKGKLRMIFISLK